jgi:hypothetical protein
MSDVFVERRWNEPLTEEGLLAMAAMSANCLSLHRVEWLGSLLASNGLDVFCHFRGPDAESVRIAAQHPDVAPGRVWACAVRDAPGTAPSDLAGTNVVVGQTLDEPAPSAAIRVRDDAEIGCFQVHRVRLLRSYLSADRRRMFSLYQAPDTESVRLARHEAGLPSDLIRAVRRYAP